jgi:hypothetical protein
VSAQGVTYSAFIDAQLQTERRRRETLDARGLAVVTTSGGLVTGLTAITAFVGSGRTYVMPSRAVLPLTLALVTLTFAAGLGIITNRAIAQEVVSTNTLIRIRTTHWTDDETDARNFIAAANIKMIESLRRGSNTKAKWLRGALSAQVLALLFLSSTVYLIVTTR